MAFKRREAVVEAVDLNTITPEDAEKRIIAGVKKYATNEGNWSKADANTPYIGQIVGMGVESQNLADITMSIERQFLTKKTKRVPVDGTGEFRLEDGELGKLRIMEGEDSLAATPGLSIKMLMDAGHMAKNDAYLSKVVSYAYIAATGDGWRMNDALRKVLAKVQTLSGAEKDESLSNLKAMVVQAKAYVAEISNPAQFSESRKKIAASDKAAVDALAQELDVVTQKLKGLAATNDATGLESARAEEAELKTRLKMSRDKLKISTDVAHAAATRTPAEEARVKDALKALGETLAQAEKL